MTRISWNRVALATAGSLLASAALAQNIIPPESREDPGVGCLVQGLDYASDGYLKLRSGPGTGFPIIGEFRNGDRAGIAAPCQGRWCYVENGRLNGEDARFRGWIYDGWCEFYR